MENNNRKPKEYISISFNLYTVFSDLIKSLWVILALSLSVACFSYMYDVESYQPSYTVRGTYIVTARGVNNDLITAMNLSQESAARFAEIINSRALRDAIAADTGYDVGHIYLTAAVIDATNLVQVEAYGITPEYAFNIYQAIERHYPQITNKTITNAAVSVLVEPTVGTKPSYELHPLRSMLKFFALCFAALGFLFTGLSCLKDTIRTGRDVEKKLDADYLGEICHEKAVRKRKKSGSASILITKKTVSFRYAENIERISRKIQNTMRKNDCKSLLITSCLEKEGKSTIAANLALSMAEQGKTVVLVDLNLRKPALYKLFNSTGVKNHSFDEIINGDKSFETIIDKNAETGIDIIFNEKSYSNSTELLTTGVFNELLNYLQKKNYDFIIIDASSMAYTADVEIIAENVDASLMAVKEHYAKAKDINDRLDALYNCRATVIGCIVNDVHMPSDSVAGRGYFRKYGYGHYSTSR